MAANPKWGTKAWGTTAWAAPTASPDSAQSIIYTPDGFQYNLNSEAGLLFDLAINGIGYIAKDTELGTYQKETQPTFVERQDSGEKNEQSFDYWWPQVFTDFIKGEGQKRLTADGSEAKFWRSTGIDISEAGEFSLLKETASVLAVNNAVVPLAVGIKADGTAIIYSGNATNDQAKYTDDEGDTWTNVATGTTGKTILDLEAAGNYMYGAMSGNNTGIYRGVVGSDTDWTSWAVCVNANSYYTRLLYATVASAGFKMFAVSYDSSAKTYGIYDLTNPAVPALVSNTVTPANWKIEDMAFGDGSLYYISHNNVDQGYVFKYDGTNTTLYDTLPPGFIPKTIEYGLDALYIGGSDGQVWVITGTSTAVVCELDTSPATTRDFTINALLVRAGQVLIGHNHLTGLSSYDLTEASLSKNVYTTLSAGDNNVVQKIIWVGGKPFFCVKNSGVYREEVTFVANGNWESSVFDYNTVARKYVITAEVEHASLKTDESIEVQISSDDGVTYDSVITNSTLNSTKTTVHFTELKANTFTLKVIISSGSSKTTTPTVKSVRLLGAPFLEGKYIWTIPIAFTNDQVLLDGLTKNNYTSYEIYKSLENIYESKQVVAFQDIDYLQTQRVRYVIVDGIKKLNTETMNDKQEGISMVTLREVRI